MSGVELEKLTRLLKDSMSCSRVEVLEAVTLIIKKENVVCTNSGSHQASDYQDTSYDYNKSHLLAIDGEKIILFCIDMNNWPLLYPL